MRKDFSIGSLKALKAIEVPDGVSDKYVPIYTSKLVEVLKPEYKFAKGYRFGSKTSKHFIDLVPTDSDKNSNEKIRIYNSFDGSFALRVYFVSENFQYNIVDNDRVVHVGEKARTISEEDNLKELKESIINAVPNVRLLKAKLENIPVDLNSEFTKTIKDVLSGGTLYYFKRQQKDENYVFVNYVDDVAKLAEKNGNPLSIYAYINLSIKNFIDGNFGFRHTKTNELKGKRAINSPLSKVQILNAIAGVLEEEFVEYMI